MEKHILSLLLVTALCASSSVTAHAADTNNLAEAPVITKNTGILQEVSEDFGVNPLAPMDYAYVWLEKSALGTFTITNNRSGSTGVTFEVESENRNAYATMWLETPNGLTVLGSQRTVKATDENTTFRITGMKGKYKVRYQAFTSGGVGMRLMCWMYD